MRQKATDTIVVKIGGSLIADPTAMEEVWSALRSLRTAGPVVLVHGGGKQMSDMADRLDHTPRRVQGRRVTTDLDLEIAQWTMSGALNTQLVAAARTHDVTAVGLSGADAGLLTVTKRPPWTIDGETVDFGWVGDVEAVDPALVTSLLADDAMPVVAPLGVDADGQLYNVNADTVASVLAQALEAKQLAFVTDAGGVRRPGDASTPLDACDPAMFEAGVDAGWISGGMRVKVRTALDALEEGVGQAVICAPDDLVRQERSTEIVRDSVP